MKEVNLRVASNLIRYAIRRGKSIFLMGPPGLGKSAIFYQIAHEESISINVWEGVSLDPTDVRGLMIPDGESSVFTKSPLLPNIKKSGDRGIILIDDMPGADRDVQKALYPAFHPTDRRIGADKIPQGWIVAATGNRINDTSGAAPILSALADRTMIVYVRPDLDCWRQDYAMPNRIHPLVMGYLGFRQDHFCTFEDRRRDRVKDFATARGWSDTSDVLYAYDEGILRRTKDNDDIEPAVQGHIGESVGIEFLGYMRVKDKLPDPIKIFKGDYVVPEEPSVAHALNATLAHILVTNPPVPRKQAVDRILEYSLKLDVAIGGILISDIYKECRKDILKSEYWQEVSKRYFP